jgi:hypothetical protein
LIGSGRVKHLAPSFKALIPRMTGQRQTNDATEGARQRPDSPIARLGQIRDALGLAMTMWIANVVNGRQGMRSGERDMWEGCEEALGVSFDDWHAIYFGAARLPDRDA